MRALLIFATGLFAGLCFGVAMFWSTGPLDTAFWVFLGCLGGWWGLHVERKVY